MSDSATPDLSVIIPAYNEEKRLGKTVGSIARYLSSKKIDYELIVVDDGSSDETSGIAAEAGRAIPGFRLLKNEGNMGKGFSVKRGVGESRGRNVLFSDADLSVPIEEVEPFLQAMDDGVDVAISTRAHARSEIVVRQPWYREMMGKTFNLFVKALLGLGCKDTQCGFKCFRGDAARRLFGLQRINGFAFDAEIVFLAGKFGYPVVEIPVHWYNSPSSRVSILGDPAGMFGDLFRIRYFDLTGKYDGGTE